MKTILRIIAMLLTFVAILDAFGHPGVRFTWELFKADVVVRMLHYYGAATVCLFLALDKDED